jgi:acetolactate synthase-1/2/3 large subunit
VDVVFGLPGGENVEVLDALRRQGVEFVLVRNESSAIFMADTHARLTGSVGVALTTLGPGAANAYAGMAHAYLDRSPVLLITAQTDPHVIGKHSHQVLDLQAVFRPVTKFTALLTPASADITIESALTRTRSGRPGPVHLSIPSSQALQYVENDSSQNKLTPMATNMEKEKIERARNLLAASQRPVILVGLGLEPDKPYAQLCALARSLSAPVIDTPKSKGVLPSDHPLFVGTLGLTAIDPAYEILQASDCILAIGFDPVELVKPWDQAQPLIWISNWENQDPHIDAACELVGNIPAILNGLLDSNHRRYDPWGEKQVASWRAAHHRGPAFRSAPNRILPSDVLDSIREQMPPETIVTTDVGSHKIFTCLHWKALRPNRFFVSNGLSVMGFGLSSAIAAARLTRAPTICITGDAGLAMMMGELALIAELDLPLVVIVMNDAALDLIRFAQKRKNLQVFGTEFANPDFEKIATAFGLGFARIQNKSECDVAVQAAVEPRKRMLLEVMVDPTGYR